MLTVLLTVLGAVLVIVGAWHIIAGSLWAGAIVALIGLLLVAAVQGWLR